MPAPGRNLLLLNGGRSYAQKVLATAPASLLAYWPLWEASGSVASDISGNARNGAYTGVDLGSPGIGDGRTSPYFDAVNDYCNVHSAALASAFNGAEGSMACWCKVFSSSVWTDATSRRLLQFRVDANNFVNLGRTAANNQLQCQYIAGGTSKAVTVATSTLNWFLFGVTWSKSADQVIVYVNGAQSGATQTALGTWAGSLSSTRCLIGADITTPGAVWNGYLAHTTLWSTPLTAAQIAALAVVS